LGGVLGWLAGKGVFSIPGCTPLLACGPMGGIFKGAITRSRRRGMKTMLMDLGISRVEAGLYEDKVTDGQVLVCLHANDWREAEAAQKMFQAVGAADITILGQKEPAEPPLQVIRGQSGILAPAVCA
jgi:hypothetical protein